MTYAHTSERWSDAYIGHAEMPQCVGTCRDCAELCRGRSDVMSRGTALTSAVCRARADACDHGAVECRKMTA